MTTFVRLQLAEYGDETLINIDQIVRVCEAFPRGVGSTIVLSDDTSLFVRASLDELQERLRMSGGRVAVLTLEPASVNWAARSAAAS